MPDFNDRLLFFYDAKAKELDHVRIRIPQHNRPSYKRIRLGP
jgi:hypothetical protein